MLEIIREIDADGFRLIIERRDGAWEVSVAGMSREELLTARGIGANFDEAWDNVAPPWT
jgi:hypothetical protein